MRIAIFRAGSVGGYFGGRLSELREDVVFIARAEHLNAMPAHGLRKEIINGGFMLQSVYHLWSCQHEVNFILVNDFKVLLCCFRLIK